MHISDWSSDVCSSDLCAEGGGDVFDHLRFGALDGEGRDPQGGEQAEPGAEEEVLLAEALLEHVDGRADAAGGGAGRGEDVGEQLEAVLGDGTVEGELGEELGEVEGLVRSEEHTSELQSLMRI